MTVRHTFLFKEGIWRLDGDYTDAHSHTCPMEGETLIMHHSGRFISESDFILHSDHPMKFHQKMEMPEIQSQDLTIWKSMDIISGLMEGKAFIVSDHIILVYNSPDGYYSGVENIIRINDVFYHSFGSIFKLEERVSSWNAEMIRVR
jgi:hypothetical protein